MMQPSKQSAEGENAAQQAVRFNFDDDDASPGAIPAAGVNNFGSTGTTDQDYGRNANNNNNAGGGDIVAEQTPAQSSGYKGVHPVAAAFHVAFKLGALLTFILGGIFSSSFVLIFILTILFIAADFWTTKNITGRILVSLRWWNEVRPDGSTQWIFESSPEAERRVNAYDSWFFWVTTGGYCACWVVLFLMNLLSISKLPITVIGMVLSGSNVFGYVKCQRDSKARITQFMVNQAARNTNVMQRVAAAMMGPDNNNNNNNANNNNKANNVPV